MPIAEGAPKPPPQKTGSAAPARKTNAADARRELKIAQYSESLTGVAQTAAFLLSIGKQHADAGALGMHAPQMIPEFAKLGADHEPTGRLLNLLTSTSPFMGVILVSIPFVMQIGANHGWVKPSSQLGTVAPEILVAEAEKDLRELERQAQEQLAAVRAENAPAA